MMMMLVHFLMQLQMKKTLNTIQKNSSNLWWIFKEKWLLLRTFDGRECTKIESCGSECGFTTACLGKMIKMMCFVIEFWKQWQTTYKSSIMEEKSINYICETTMMNGSRIQGGGICV